MHINTILTDRTNLNNYLFISLIVMNIFDFITTYIGIMYFGAREVNLVMATAIELVGTVWAIFGGEGIGFWIYLLSLLPYSQRKDVMGNSKNNVVPCWI